MGKLRSKEVSNDLLGPIGRWGLEWRVKANTQQILSPSHLTKSTWKSKGKGSLLRCRAEQRRAENGSGKTESDQHVDHIHNEDSPYEWWFSSFSKALCLTHHNSICIHLKWRLCTCVRHYLHNLLTILGAVSVLRVPSQLHQDLPGTCGLLHGGLLHKETKHFWWANPLLLKVSIYYCFLKMGDGSFPASYPIPFLPNRIIALSQGTQTKIDTKARPLRVPSWGTIFKGTNLAAIQSV